MATHSSILAWKVPWTEEPSGLTSMGSQRIGHDWVTENPGIDQYLVHRKHFMRISSSSPLLLNLWVRAQSCPTLCDAMDCNPSGYSVHGIFQARILEWVDISSSRGSSQPRDQTPTFWKAEPFTTEPSGKPLLLNLVYQNRQLINHKISMILVKMILSKND